MRIFKILLPLLIISMIQSQCSLRGTDSDDQSEKKNFTGAEKKLAQSGNEFAFKLFQGINNEGPNSNIFISPLSVSYALGMAYNGAAGETREAIQNTLELSGLSLEEINISYKGLMNYLTGCDEKLEVSIANSIWSRNGVKLKDQFVGLNSDYFDATVTSLDFSSPDAAEIINNWVDDNTNGKIAQIVQPPIDPAMMLFLINAVYFKGTWTYQFDPNETRDEIFYAGNPPYKTYPFMAQKVEIPYFANTTFHAVDIPYGDGLYRMAVLVPISGSIDDLAELCTSDNWDIWMDSFVEQEVNLFLPKFKLELAYKLNDVLISLGMGAAFNGALADFSNITETIGLYISKVKHITFVEVNEEGTEAAAVTSIEMCGSTGEEPLEIFFRADRPFLFVIHETESNSILFMGKVMQPTQ